MKITGARLFIVVTLMAHILLAFFPGTCMELYQGYLYGAMRKLFDFTIGLSPLPFIYPLVVLFFYYIIMHVIQDNSRRVGSVSSVFLALMKKISFLSVILVCIFYWVWGFNYYQENLSSRMNLGKVHIDSAYIREEICEVIPRLNALREDIKEDEILSLKGNGYKSMESTIRVSQENILQKMGWKPSGKVRVRRLPPEGFLLGWSTSGIYIPFSFEGHLDPGLHPLQYPFTLAHEMAHGYGVTNEGDCNTIALISCMHTGSPLYEYAALLTYFRYLWFDARWSEKQRTEISAFISAIVREDLVAIKNQADKFPDFLPRWRDIVYEAYLHWMGVDDGLDSYHSIVDKMAALHEQYPALTKNK